VPSKTARQMPLALAGLKIPAKRAKPKFSGALAEPIVVKAYDSAGQIVEDADYEENETLRKLELLADHYGINRESDWPLLLAYKLARDFVPGFE
jgi:hypothetical protein